MRERFFTPRLRVSSYEELNALLLDRCVAYAKAHKHPEITDQTIWQVFEAERARLVQIIGRFDGFHAVTAAVSKTCLVRFDNNKYSVASRAVGRPVEVQAYADRIVIRQDGEIVGEHARCFGRGRCLLRSLALRPGAGAQARGAQGTGRRSKTGSCRRTWSRSGESSNDRTTAIGRWWPFSQLSSTFGLASVEAASSRGAQPRCSLGRCRPQHPGAPTRPRAGGNHPHP